MGWKAQASLVGCVVPPVDKLLVRLLGSPKWPSGISHSPQTENHGCLHITQLLGVEDQSLAETERRELGFSEHCWKS